MQKSKVNKRNCFKITSLSQSSFIMLLTSNQLPYRKGYVTERMPGWGPLAAFDTQKNAEDFIKSLVDDHFFLLWECEVEESEDKSFWRFDEYIKNKPSTKWPTGTVFCDTIQLTRLVGEGYKPIGTGSQLEWKERSIN